MSDDEPEDDVYTVESVVGVTFDEESGRFRYEVKWEGFEETTMEPLEHLTTCPFKVLDFEKEQFKDLSSTWRRRKAKPTPWARGRRKPKLTVSLFEVTDDEYVPEGNESVAKIYGMFSEENVDFYAVKFYKIPDEKKVRIQFLEYYFPMDLLKFWFKNPTCLKQ